MTNKEYEALNGIRVSEIVNFATKNIETIIQEYQNPKETNQNMLLGTAYHYFILRSDRDTIPNDIEVLDFGDYRTTKAKEARQKALDNGKIPLLTKDLATIQDNIKKLMPTLDEFFPSTECDFEKVFCDSDATFGDIKGRVDAIHNDTILDLKVSTNTLFLDKKIFDMGYQLQMFLYMNLAKKDTAKLVFLNPDSLFVKTKRLNIGSIENECIVLLKRAKRNMMLLEAWKNGEYTYENEGDYQAPQWALYSLNELDGNF